MAILGTGKIRRAWPICTNNRPNGLATSETPCADCPIRVFTQLYSNSNT